VRHVDLSAEQTARHPVPGARQPDLLVEGRLPVRHVGVDGVGALAAQCDSGCRGQGGPAVGEGDRGEHLVRGLRALEHRGEVVVDDREAGDGPGEGVGPPAELGQDGALVVGQEVLAPEPGELAVGAEGVQPAELTVVHDTLEDPAERVPSRCEGLDVVEDGEGVDAGLEGVEASLGVSSGVVEEAERPVCRRREVPVDRALAEPGHRRQVVADDLLREGRLGAGQQRTPTAEALPEDEQVDGHVRGPDGPVVPRCLPAPDALVVD
jgi:hypothetical protein